MYRFPRVRIEFDLASGLVFLGGALVVALKNYFLAGLDGGETVFATLGLVVVKTLIGGVYYKRTTDWLVACSGVRSQMWQRVMRDFSYAILQTVTFAGFVMLVADAEKWPRAIAVTFATSAIVAPLINRVVLPRIERFVLRFLRPR